MSQNQYPLDFDALAKGSRIPSEQLETIFGAKAGTPQYAFKAMALQARIRQELEARALGAVTTRLEKYDILVLTDVDASKYNHDDINHKIGGMFSAFRRLLGVDSSGFNDAQGKIHTRRVENQGKVLQALASVTRRKLETTPYKRIAPLPNQAAGE